MSKTRVSIKRETVGEQERKRILEKVNADHQGDE